MRRFFKYGFVALLILFPTWGQERAPLNSVFPLLEAYIEKSMAAEGIPGAVVVVVKDGKIAYIKGFGVKIVGQKEPIDEHTPFALASVTKTFTNMLIARLVDQGKLHWKDKVSKYLPDLKLQDPKVSQDLLIEDLLSHRSGLPGFAGDSLIELGWDSSQIMLALKNIPIDSAAFRNTYAYQNVTVGLVGPILEKVTGKPLAQLFQEELFEPVGLQETRLGTAAPLTLWEKILGIFRKKAPEPTFHDVALQKTRNMPNGNPGILTFPASSGIISTGLDIGKWMIFQLNNGEIDGKAVVSAASLNEMRTPHVDLAKQGHRQFPKNRVTKVHYGMGWFIQDYAGVSVLSHMGGMRGTRSLIFMIPEEKLGIAVLANMGGMRVSLFPEGITHKFMDLYLKVPDEQDWAKTLFEESKSYREKYEKHRRVEMLQSLAPARNLDDYTGIYENALYGRLEIGKEGDALTLTYKDRPKVKLDHWNGNAFQFPGSDLSFGFSGYDQGEVIFSQEKGKSDRMMVTLLHEGVDSVFERVKG
ncbi:MAG: serine hydrolase [Alphaproteobacteria bacterium]|jgi:CubicO group peptidase (beta-lactamase class C family)|nr:serine hydrolase [Alphaproteobacteria bacterium]